jgi:uncharacterized protein with ATP-grasp and redox domains
MKPFIECAPCILKWVYERSSSSANEEQQHALMRTIMGVLSQKFLPSGNLGLICKKALDAVNEFVLAAEAHYSGIKMRTNHVAKGLLPSSREFIGKGETPQERFRRTCCLASAGNVSTIGAPAGAYEFPEVENIIMGRGSIPLYIGDVYEAAKKAHRVLFLADNAGEIGFDSLLIEELKEMGLRVTLVVKEAPFFEDATIEDACFFDLDNLADNILTTKSVFIPGYSTPPLEEVYKKSDLVIAKGVFNFESLAGEDLEKPVIYMLKMKCRFLSRLNNAHLGDVIVRLEKVQQARTVGAQIAQSR